MDLNVTLKSYLESLESSSPTPGGGNVSAFCGVLATALGKMVCNLTIGKKKYIDVEHEIKENLSNLSEKKIIFEDLAKKDNEAFDDVMAAFKLPKDTDEQKSIRAEAIENTTKKAANIPFEVIKTCNLTLNTLAEVVLKGNKNSVSDAGVAVLLMLTAAKGAYLNVIINCASLSDKSFAKNVIDEATGFINELEVKVNFIFSSLKKDILNEN